MEKPVTTTATLPAEFLRTPCRDITIQKIDFSAALPEYASHYAVVLDNVLSLEECDILISAAEAHGAWERATINIGAGIQAPDEETRKCGRMIWDSQELADRIWQRVRRSVPELALLENNACVMGWWAVDGKEV